MLHDKIETRKDKSTERFTQTLAISCMSLTSFTFTSVPWRITIFYISFLRVDWALNIVHYFNMNFFYFFKYNSCRLVYLSAVVALWDQGSVERSVPGRHIFWHTQLVHSVCCDTGGGQHAVFWQAPSALWSWQTAQCPWVTPVLTRRLLTAH